MALSLVLLDKSAYGDRHYETLSQVLAFGSRRLEIGDGRGTAET